MSSRPRTACPQSLFPPSPSSGVSLDLTRACIGVPPRVRIGTSTSRFPAQHPRRSHRLCGRLLRNKFRTVEVGFGFKTSRSKGTAGFLTPGGNIRQVETYNEKRRFEEYLLHNYNTIRAMHPYKDLQTLVILQGATLASSWCRGLVRSRGRELQGFVSIDVAPLLPVFKVGVGSTMTVHHPVSNVK